MTRITEMHLIITEYEWGKLEIECDFTDGDMLSEEVHKELWSNIKKVEDNSRDNLKLIHTNIEVTEFKTKDSAFKIVILIFFASFFDFAQFLLLCLIP